MRTLISWGLLGMMLVMIGCTPIKTKTPLSACPLAQRTASFDNGTIFKADAIRPLFEDRHARNVGDELTITIGEVPTPTEKSSSNAGKSGGPNAALPSDSRDVKASGSGGKSTFSGSIIATVVVVMDNGKLLVCGDKLVKYANADMNFEYVRISGVINPNVISVNNTVPSTQIADVQIEYRNADNIDASPAAQTFVSRLSRFFMPKQLYF
jgi:flagellar L-ring protein precursor FlgH